MEKITREKAIQMLIEDDEDTIQYELNTTGKSEMLENMLREGWEG